MTKDVDVPTLFKLWNDPELSKPDVAFRLGISTVHLLRLKKRYGLPEKPWRRRCVQVVPDPTPEEIAERAAECRAKWSTDERRRERVCAPQYRYNARTGVFTPGEVA